MIVIDQIKNFINKTKTNFGFNTYGNNINRISASVPLEEKTVNTIAKHFSMLQIDIDYKGNKKSSVRSVEELLKVRPNKKQTPTEFYHSFFYQLFNYNFGIIAPIYKDGYLTELEVIDLYNKKLGTTIDDKGNEFLVIINCVSRETLMINYEDIILLRNNPQSVFNGELDYSSSSSIPRIIDTELSNLLTELNDAFEINGIIKLGSQTGGLNATQLNEEAKQQKVNDLIKRTKKRLIVLDSGEHFEKIETNSKQSTMKDVTELLNLYSTLYGIPISILNNTWTYEEYSTFMESILMPKIKAFSEELNYKLLTKLERENAKIKININKMAGVSFKDKMEFLNNSRYQGYGTANEIREEIGWVKIPGGDELLGNLNMKDLNQGIKGGEK